MGLTIKPKMRAPVSVVIPVFNGEDTLLRTLESVAGQVLPPAEVIIADDGSSDRSAAIAMGFEFPAGIRKTVIRQRNRGVAAARNAAVAVAGQPYVAFLDADDTWLPEKLQTCIREGAAGGWDLVCHDFFSVRGAAAAVVESSARQHRGANVFTALYLRNFLCTSTAMVRREVLVAQGWFREGWRRAEDYDLWLRIVGANPCGLKVIAHPLTRWQDRDGSLSKSGLRLYARTLMIAALHAPSVWRLSPKPLWVIFQRVALIHGELAAGMLVRLCRFRPFRRRAGR